MPCIKLCHGELHNFFAPFTKYSEGGQLKRDEMGGACSTQEANENNKFVQNIGWKTQDDS